MEHAEPETQDHPDQQTNRIRAELEIQEVADECGNPELEAEGADPSRPTKPDRDR